MRAPLLLAAATLLGAAAPAALAAQVIDSVALADSTAGAVRGPLFEVSAVTGYQWFDRAAALEGTPTAGLRLVLPRVLDAFPAFYLGASGAFARPTTRGEYFPWNRQIYYSGEAARLNDTSLVYSVSQHVSMAYFGLDAGLRFGGRAGGAPMRSPMDWRSVFVDASVGAGVYGFWEDPEQSRRNELHAFRGWLLGGGLGIPLPGNTHLALRAEDLVFIRYDRNWFSLHDPLFRDELFPNLQSTPPAAKGTVHNLRLTAQFSFVPGRGVSP